jgi:hypothetical protein
MFAILVISASAAAPNFGSWAADHTSKLRAWTCTPTRLAYHMCEANTGGANATGTGFAAATPAGKTQINRYNLCSCEATLILKSFEFRGLTVPSCVQPQTGRPPPPWRRRRVANGPWMSTREASRRSYRLLLLASGRVRPLRRGFHCCRMPTCTEIQVDDGLESGEWQLLVLFERRLRINNSYSLSMMTEE